MKTAILAAISVVGLSAVVAAEQPSRLTGFPGVGRIVVASTHSDLGEPRLRGIVEGRLQKAGLFLESPPAASGSLSVRVSGDHNSSARGAAYTFYDVALTVTEPASLERDSSIQLPAVVWQRTMRVCSFARELPAEAIVDKVNDLLNSFTSAVEAARQGR